MNIEAIKKFSAENEAKWETLEGHAILRVPGQPLAALPCSGRKNSRVFQVFNVETRETECQLTNREVHSWLYKRAFDEAMLAGFFN